MLPKVLLPATTALSTIHPEGRKMGILAGANVVMPNLTPEKCRESYLLYDNKIGTKGAPGDTLKLLEQSLLKIGFSIDKSRGDYKGDE
jgi:biotin synthase